VGQAASELLDARGLAEFAARWMTKRFGSGGATPPAG
jgi:hypothetical protein